MSRAKKRGIYFLIFGILFAVEIYIAVFVHDAFVRPYLGDVLVVGVVYCFIRIFLPERVVLLPLYVFIFALTIEILQLFDFAGRIGLENKILRIILGSVFDWKDIGCYAVGCAVIAAVDCIRFGVAERS